MAQDAGTATLELRAGQDPRAARLVLTDVSGSTVYFTDTPKRVAGKLATYSFVSLFNSTVGSFGALSPRAGGGLCAWWWYRGAPIVSRIAVFPGIVPH